MQLTLCKLFIFVLGKIKILSQEKLIIAMSNRIGTKIEQTNDNLTIIIPPAYTWNNHSWLFYIFLIAYLIFAVINIAFGLHFGILGQAYLLCFLISFICSRNFAATVLHIQSLFLIMIFLEPVIESGSSLFIALSILSIAEKLVLGGFKNSVFREVIGTTYIKLEPSKLSISKKILFFYQTDFVSHTTRNKSKKILELLMTNKHSSKLYTSISLLNQARINNLSQKKI